MSTTRNTRTSQNSEKASSDVITQIGNILDEKLKPLNQRLEKIENSLSYALDELGRINDLEDKSKTQKKEISCLQSELATVKLENHALKEQILKQETFSRRNNLRIVGISCQNDQSLEHTVMQVFEKAGVDVASRDIEHVHYTGRQRGKENRPVLVRFTNYKDKERILKARDNMNRLHISVHDDFPVEVIQRRRVLLPIFYKSREAHRELNPKLVVDRLMLGGQVYDIDNIDGIQYPDLQPKNVFTPSKLGVQGFFSKHSPLSNHHRAEFQLDGKKFSSSEQCFMYKKAMYFHDQETAQKIMATADAAEAKRLGSSVNGFKKDKWSKVAPDMMFESMYAKFSQNESLKSFLLSTGRNTLVEANQNDKYWGCGLALGNTDIFDPSKWKGKNFAGKTLEKVRLNLQ